MKPRAPLLALLPLLFAAGCAAYRGSYVFATSRRLLASDAPLAVEVVAAPVVLVPETLLAPFGAYCDALRDARRDPAYRRSFLGLRTLLAADLAAGYRVLGALPVAAVDTALLPVAFLADRGYAVETRR